LVFEPLPCIRLAQPFEALRDASDRLLARTGARPRVFLANLGRPADFTARTTFAKNFFEAGGIEAVTNDGFGSRDEMIEAFKASGAKAACLCASDEVYAREATAAVQALQDVGASVWVAGRGGALEAAHTKAGARGFIFAGCDTLAVLRTTHSLIAS
jgi:methylmalonyl-CoA mutase